MKTVRCNQATYVKLLGEKHKLEIQKMDTVNLSDVMDVVMIKLEAFTNGSSVEEVEALKFRFIEAADVVAEVVSVGEDDEDSTDDSEDETPTPRKKRPVASKAATKKRRRPSA